MSELNGAAVAEVPAPVLAEPTEKPKGAGALLHEVQGTSGAEVKKKPGGKTGAKKKSKGKAAKKPKTVKPALKVKGQFSDKTLRLSVVEPKEALRLRKAKWLAKQQAPKNAVSFTITWVEVNAAGEGTFDVKYYGTRSEERGKQTMKSVSNMYPK